MIGGSGFQPRSSQLKECVLRLACDELSRIEAAPTKDKASCLLGLAILQEIALPFSSP